MTRKDGGLPLPEEDRCMLTPMENHRLNAGQEPRLYDHLAALAGALALGVSLADAAARLGGN